jgi:hypothetical protein
MQEACHIAGGRASPYPLGKYSFKRNILSESDLRQHPKQKKKGKYKYVFLSILFTFMYIQAAQAIQLADLASPACRYSQMSREEERGIHDRKNPGCDPKR